MLAKSFVVFKKSHKTSDFDYCCDYVEDATFIPPFFTDASKT